MHAKRISVKALSLSVWLGALLCLTPAQADNKLRWFEVEVLVFKQDGSEATNAEHFALDMQPIPLRNYYDLIEQLYSGADRPLFATLPECDTDASAWLAALPEITADAAMPLPYPPELPELRFCRSPRETALVPQWYISPDFDPTRLPRPPAATIVDGKGGDISNPDTLHPFLMPQDSHQLVGVRDQLVRQRGKELLLHTTWRQPVFSRTRGRKIRLFGGENYSHEYAYTGHEKPDMNEVIDASDQGSAAEQRLSNIERLLQRIEAGDFAFVSPDPHAQSVPELPEKNSAWPEDVWEFDGLMHIYLVGNYLHIDGEFNLRDEIRLPVQASKLEAQARAELADEAAEIPFLRAYYFSQLRRVISHETHYFDHPHYGVVVQIRRTELSHRR
ncbi:CsiV family protein [Aliidiomarina sp. Khilg15.8]